MRRLTQRIHEQLIEDSRLAESLTVCRRRGTVARAGYIVDEGFDSLQWSVNGSPKCAAIEAGCGCVHAEQRLITQLLKTRIDGPLVMLTTLEPCEQCANLIVESELFSKVFYLRDYRAKVGRAILSNAGIHVEKV